ncbi:MAG TPA: nucleoside triphosphate pyrophosphohydrolase [Steroidobacteraceae bacterium]|jgi:nucleoside triphosphate diphosphatase|nr:nucleoside triphosphate pyrophosphohydrolase [Steroidobacteraceae bacterium]
MGDARAAIEALITLMARLRDPQRGCPWDLEQTFASIAPFTVEEAYEVADAIERGEHARLRDELGDLLFQVVFHARMAEERGWFDFAQVAESIHAKLVRRHPHVFAGAAIEAQHLPREWEAQKAREREQAAGELGDRSALAGVPKALPALMRAAKLGRRAARVGFDWPDAAGTRAKVAEELGELDVALAEREAAAPLGTGEAVAEELGDLLFAVVNFSRHLNLDAEAALRGANAKFERRFRRMERLAHERGLALERLSAAQWDELWQEAKLNAS